MAMTTITLFVANLAAMASVGVYLGKEIGKQRTQLEKTEAVLYSHISATGEVVGYDVAEINKKIDEKLEVEELKKHISKEFLAMAYRGIKIADLSKMGGKGNE